MKKLFIDIEKLNMGDSIDRFNERLHFEDDDNLFLMDLIIVLSLSNTLISKLNVFISIYFPRRIGFVIPVLKFRISMNNSE